MLTTFAYVLARAVLDLLELMHLVHHLSCN